MEIYRPVIMENFAHADIIKGSDEDFTHILCVHSATETWLAVQNMCDMLVYTANKDDVKLCRSDVYDSYPIPPITPISTIGAGDTFNAGLIYGLTTHHLNKDELKYLNCEQRDTLIGYAIRFAGHVCMSYDNYISLEFAKEVCQK